MNLFTRAVRPLIVALLSLFTVFLVAQPAYRPTAVEGAKWVIVDSETHNYPYSTFVRSIQGDTILDGIAYKKLYQQVVNYLETQGGPALTAPYEVFPEKELIALLRDDVDARKVYGRTKNFNVENSELSSDTLFHDYAVEAGAFISGYFFVMDSVEVNEIGEAFLFGQMRRYQSVGGVRFIEGIGSAMGPTSGDSFLYLNCCDWRLVEYCVGDFADCNIISPVVNLSDDLQVTIFPNPVNDVLHLSLSQPSATPIGVTLMDGFGRVLRNATLREPVSWSLADLPAGAYFVVLAQGNGTVSRKIIKR